MWLFVWPLSINFYLPVDPRLRLARYFKCVISLANLSVIVPTRNEAHNIGRLLASLPAAVRLRVVDASEDETVRRVQKLRPRNTTVLRNAANVTVAVVYGCGRDVCARLF